MQIISLHMRIGGAILFLFLFFYTVYLLRSQRLAPQHAMKWIIAELVMLLFILCDPITQLIVKIFGAENTISVIVLLAGIWGILLMLDSLVRISELNNKLRAIDQELAILNEKFEKLRKSIQEHLNDEKN